MEYTVGFLFSSDAKYVALIEKKRPAWQAGRWNGIGGKIEPGETPLDCMRREFSEEAGAIINDWHRFAVLRSDTPQPGSEDASDGYAVHMFCCFGDDVFNLQAKTDEEVRICLVDSVAIKNVIPNLRWLIPMALSIASKVESATEFEVIEKL